MHDYIGLGDDGDERSKLSMVHSNGTTSAKPVAKNRSHFQTNPSNPAAMVIPFRHVETPFDFTAEEWTDFGVTLNEAKRYLAEFQPEGFTIGWNAMRSGGSTFFMPTFTLSADLRKTPRRGEDSATLSCTDRIG
jgi:hypothetical protein